MLEKCHHFTLTDALVTIQTINLSVPGSELEPELEPFRTETENLVSHY